ncbi:MAG: pyrroline-5-carboxylate reductase [Clostridia bacterium]|nr:pyrroline-5-carboxylate reductase [Clostridia bacterium]
MKKLAFIGMGNMASALLQGFLKSGRIAATDICAYDPCTEKLKRAADAFGFTACPSLLAAVNAADTVLMACKPQHVEGVLTEIKDALRGKILLSIALGWDFARYSAILSDDVRIQFVMPNTPALVSEGVFLFEETNSLSQDESEQIHALFSTVGMVTVLPTHLMGIGGAVTGCGPAFADLFIEAFGDAAVKYGMPRELSYALISQMLLGSAKLQAVTGTHPAVLKDAVCSPGGSTIRGVTALEKSGFRAACQNAIDEIMKK